ncbi:MAG: phytase [Bacteroidales bacterium]|nr:phytase [Bacteroidales bacterium]
MERIVLFLIAGLFVSAICGSCQSVKKEEKAVVIVGNTEVREDSVKMAKAFALQSKFENRIRAVGETEPLSSDPGEDAADDPAIWFNAKDPGKSLIIGTNKKSGLWVFNLDGITQQVINTGRINNVDLCYGFPYGGNDVSLVAGSNRDNNSITLFYINPDTGILSDSIFNIRSGVDEVYGLCFYKDTRESRFFVFVNGKGGKIEQWEIISSGTRLTVNLARAFYAGSQPEGMVADDTNNILYLGVEEAGIFRVGADPQADTALIKISGSDQANDNISYDIEGLALMVLENKTYLVASIQGNFSYAVFETGEHERYLTSFIIEDGIVDGVEETDGIEIFSFPISARFPYGLLIVQDGFNRWANNLSGQNFKLISLEDVIEFIEIFIASNAGKDDDMLLFIIGGCL